MSARFRNNQPTILILADFSDGSWHATSFAMQYLYNEKSPVSILQTYQNPGWGHFMMRKLSHHLEKITKNELKTLKNKLLKHFKIDRQKVNTLSIEGELNSVLNYKPIINGRHHLVLSISNSLEDSCKRQNGCLEKMIDTVESPLFILPQTFEVGTSKKILFVGNARKKSSEQLYNQVIEICKKTHSNLEVLFVIKTPGQKVPGDLFTHYREYCKEIDITFSTVHNKTKCKGISNYLNNTTRDLIVIEND